VNIPPSLTSQKSFSHIQKGIAPSGNRNLLPRSPSYKLQTQPSRGHDQSDIAALSVFSSDVSMLSEQDDSHQESQTVNKKVDISSLATGALLSSDASDLSDDGEPQGPFEGPEKLLELWFADSKDEVAGKGLLEVDGAVWEEMLDIVKCKVLSTIKSSHVNAYLLRWVI
jgi:S-adenosylmethionine decarboxylase